MNSTQQSATSSTTPQSDRAKVVQHLKSMGGIKRMAGMLGIRSLAKGLAEQDRNEAAENAAVRKVWGYDQPPQSGDDMGDQFVAGDQMVEHHHHVIQKSSSLGKLALAAAIGGPLAILAWKLPEILKPEPAPVVQPETQVIREPGTDESWRIGEVVVE